MARVPPVLPLHLSLFHGTCVSSLSLMFMSIDMLSGSYFDCSLGFFLCGGVAVLVVGVGMWWGRCVGMCVSLCVCVSVCVGGCVGWGGEWGSLGFFLCGVVAVLVAGVGMCVCVCMCLCVGGCVG